MTKRKTRIIDVKPTPAGYANALLLILENSLSPEDKVWAKQQIVIAFIVAARSNPAQWGKEVT
jgi:hypothetical protein